jgi:hypothetical protein
LCSITVVWIKLPMVMITSGHTQRVERNQLEDIESHMPMHIISGRTTKSSFKEYLRFLRTKFAGPAPLY